MVCTICARAEWSATPPLQEDGAQKSAGVRESPMGYFIFFFSQVVMRLAGVVDAHIDSLGVMNEVADRRLDDARPGRHLDLAEQPKMRDD